MGYQGSEIKAMTPEVAKAKIEAVKSVPPPTEEQVARATETAKQVQQFALEQEQKKIAEAQDASLAKARAAASEKGIAEAEKIIAEVEADPTPLSKIGEVLKADQLANLDSDPTLQTLVEIAPKSQAEVMEMFKARLRERADAVPLTPKDHAPKAEAAPVVETKAPQTREELQEYLRKKRSDSRRRKAEEPTQEDIDWEKRLADEGLPKELSGDLMDEDGSITLDSLGMQQTYERLSRAIKNVFRSAYDDESHLIRDILRVHTDGKIDADVTYSKGVMWGKVGVQPTMKFDKFPQTSETIQADISKRIPVDDNTLSSVMFDPPFLVSGNRRSVSNIGDRFTTFKTIDDAWAMYKDTLHEIFRVLKPGGKAIVKIQDVSIPGGGYSKGNYFSSAEMYNFGVQAGFRPVDRVINLNPHAMPLAPNIKVQQTARKIHTDYWVFEKPKGKFVQPSESGVTFDSLGGQQLYDWTKKLFASEKVKQDAPSKKIIAEINGRSLTMRGDAEHVDGVMKNIALNIARFARSKGMSPDFAYRNNKKVEPLTFALHKRVYEANFEASKHNEVVRSAESLLPDVASKERIKDLVERKTTEGTPAELEAARLIRGELDVVKEKYKSYLREEYKRNLNEDENAALAEILSGQPIEEVIARYKTHVVPDKLGRRKVRKWLDEEVVKDIAKEYNDIDSWGIDDYMSHYERGPMRIVSGGKLYAKAMSEADAARKFADLVQLYPDKDFQLDTESNMEALATGLTKRSYNRLLFNLQEGIRKNIEGINSQAAFRLAQKGLKGRFFITPTQQFSPYTMDRKEFLQGEKNVFDVLYHYMYSMEKKMHLDPAITDIRKAISRQDVVGTEQYKAKDGTMKTREIKKPYLNKEESDFLSQLVTDVKGRYYAMDKLVDGILAGTGHQRAYSKMIQGARELEANLKLGYAPVKGLINGASGVGHIWTKLGSGYIAKGTAFLRTAEGKAFIDTMEPYLGVNIVESATGQLSVKGSLEKTLERHNILTSPEGSLARKAVRVVEPLAVFQAPEVPVRKLTVAANYLMAKDSGLSEAAARDAAIKANWFQQFTYDMASLPEIMRGPTGRLITQFKPYMLKELEFISTLRGPEVARYIGMQLALGGPRGLVIIAKSLPILGAMGVMDEVEEWMNKELPRVSRGIGGALGVDISAAATFQFPATVKDWLGPVLSDLVAFHKNIVTPLLEGKGIDGSDLMKEAGTVFPITRYYRNLFEQVIDKDGWVKDERGRRLWHIDNTEAFVAKNVMGAEPIELNRIRTAERILQTRKMRITDQKTSMIDDILDTIAKGKPLDAAMIEKMGKLGINPGSLRRAAQFRVLDPMQRRLLQTEIIRRPEILEHFPQASDLQ
jgi:hypothetical protein